MCLWGTSAIDLSYLFYLICNADARERRVELLESYHEEFKSTLKNLGYLGRIPTLHDFNLDLLKNGAMGELNLVLNKSTLLLLLSFVEVILCVSVMLFQFMDFSDMKTEETYDIDNSFTIYRLAMRHPEYTKAMKIELPRLVSLGLIG